MIPLFDLKSQYTALESEINAAVHQVIKSGQYILGQTVEDFENKICSELGSIYGIGVASGTDALILTLRAIGIGPGDEVIVPAFSFWSTASAVMLVGATPIFHDIERDNYTLNPDGLASKINDRTMGIIVTHLYGNPGRMSQIAKIAGERHIPLIEDNAQAFFARDNELDYFTGTMGIAGCLSFFPTKPLGGIGDGGMIITDHPWIAERVKILRAHGWKRKYYPDRLGYNSRLDAIQAAVLTVKLKRTREWMRKRNQTAVFYRRIFHGFDPAKGLVPEPPFWGQSALHLFPIAVKDRDRFIEIMNNKGIQTGVYYPVSLPRAYNAVIRDESKLVIPEMFPVSEWASRHLVCIPCHEFMTHGEIYQVAESVLEVLR